MVVMLAMMFAFLLIYETSLTINDAAIDNFEIENQVYHTAFSLSSLGSPQGNDDPDFTLTNDGQEKLWDFENFLVLIEYDGEANGGTRYVETFTYSGSCSGNPPVGNWCIDAWNNDNMEPNILNTGESIDIIATTSDDLENTGLIVVSVSTENGVTATISDTI